MDDITIRMFVHALLLSNLDSCILCDMLESVIQYKDQLDQFSCFCIANGHYRLQWTDRPHYSVYSKRPHLDSAALRPKNSDIITTIKRTSVGDAAYAMSHAGVEAACT